MELYMARRVMKNRLPGKQKNITTRELGQFSPCNEGPVPDGHIYYENNFR
jgi:hypothetical protein